MNANLPKAYKEGHQDFYGRDFIVTPDVLIPRPETEQIIDTVLNLAGKSYLPGVKSGPNKLPNNPIILDVGTGSGCIAITIKKELPDAKVYATDISEPALKIAQKNAQNHGVSIPFIISHLLEKVNCSCRNSCPHVVDSKKRTNSLFSRTPSAVNIPIPDVIVANLPYVDGTWDWLDKSALVHEPSIALYAEDHGLKLIKELIDQAAKLHISRLILEADPCQHKTIINYAQKAGFSLAETRGFILLLVAL